MEHARVVDEQHVAPRPAEDRGVLRQSTAQLLALRRAQGLSKCRPRCLRTAAPSRLRMCAPHCARLVDSSGGCGDLDAWERGDGPPPALALHTNVANGRAFAEPPSPAFEVLPALARSVLQLLEAGVAGLRAGGLAAASSAEADVRADLFDLLDLLVEHKVLITV